MATPEAQAEPSMEEILASIRRIISEEDQPAPAKGEVLELTQPADDKAPPEDDLMVFEDEPAPVAAVAQPAPAPAPTPAPIAAAPTPAPAPVVAARAPEPAPVASAAPEDAIISDRVAAVAAGAFTKLAGNLRVADAAGQTLEGMIRQLVRPMLKEWLDENLPAIVNAQVEAELERIARLSR
jgi:uncharacterized protein